MGKGRPRKVEKGVVGGNSSGGLSIGCGSVNIPAGPVFYPTEAEFKDPLEYIDKIRPGAEPYGICKIVPPKSWKPPFALDLDSFTFPTKTQAIHQLQARSASCDSKTFVLEYNRFLEQHCGKKAKKRFVFEGEELDLCKLFNAVKRFGGYDSVVKGKKWGEVFRFVQPQRKITECAKHVLCQLYLEHLYDYEEYLCRLNREKKKGCKRGVSGCKKSEPEVEVSGCKRRRKNKAGERVEQRKLEEGEPTQICEQCRSGLHEEVMLLCDRCNKGWHTYCLSPPLKRVPPGNWYCFECLNSEKDTFGFVPGKQFSLEAFKRVADRVKKKWFGSASISRVQLEKMFWEIVEGSVGEVEVMYGSDLDTSVYGSGFPRVTDERSSSVEDDIWDEYCSSPWNLNNLPRLQGSMLRAVHHNIAGVMVPWLYIGMLFSSFCWHFEDHCFYSMNYLHWGEPKCWYSVPGNDACAFEKVMQDSLPDLFDAQPDLLFQLVTMLNPSVLLAKGVPVYSIIQEPGNFVITFPRSYHGGFNFGLNCAEAVNFAPADWLPHGGFGSELYRRYRKAAVLSHDELVCVVGKSEFDSRVSTYLKKELVRIHNKEKTSREKLWRNGIIRSSPMLPRELPEYVGTEEDPTCIICQQSLYLSAVACNCRASASVCLEHWDRLCECNPNKLCLFYRHTLKELNDLVLRADKTNFEETSGDSKRDLCWEKPVTLAKKVKGGHVMHLQLAEEWLLKSHEILKNPYTREAYACALKEAEQFLWAGSEMDLVRDMAKNMIEAQNWVEAVRDCLSKVKLWSFNQNHGTERVRMDQVNELLRLGNAPCSEPSHLQLKEYHQEASKLIEEINSALSVCSEISVADWEALYSKALDSPIYVDESEKLGFKLSAVKVWVDSVRSCISKKSPGAVEVDVLHKLEAEILELQLKLPEAELLSDLTRQAKSCRSQCKEMLKDSISLKKVELFLKEWDGFTVNIQELNLLKQYYSDAISWVSHVNRVLVNVHEREDQENVIDELTKLHRDGSLMKIQVEELPCVEIELKKACCRVKALKALDCGMSMEFIQQLIMEATALQIEKEKLFVDISRRHAVAVRWEEKAKHVLASEAQMSEFEDILRASEDMCIILPSLIHVKDAVSTAKAWLDKSKPFLSHDLPIISDSNSHLKVDSLKKLVAESKLLKVYLDECSLAEEVLKKCIEWEQDASSLLLVAENLLKIDSIGDGNTSCLIPRFQNCLLSLEPTMEAGFSLGLELNMIPKLQDACFTLHWCIKTLSFSAVVPTCEEVDMTLEDAAKLPVTFKSCALWGKLIDGIHWLRKALQILAPHNCGQFELISAEEVLVLHEKICVPFPMIVGQLQNSIHKHNLWVEQVHQFFRLGSEDRSWNILLLMKELGTAEAFSCVELEKVYSEVDKIQQWKRCCEDIIKPSTGNGNTLISTLLEIKKTLDRSFGIYKRSKNSKAGTLCICCCIDINDQELWTCSICKDCFHLQCTKLPLGNANDMTLFICSYCNFVKNPKLHLKGSGLLRIGQKHPELDRLNALLSDADDHCLWIEERRILHQIVEKSHAWNACLTELVDFALAHLDQDLSAVIEKMCIAYKAIELAGTCDGKGYRKFELALARNSWKIRTQKLLESAEKPTIQQIQRLLKEGLAISIPPEDYYRHQLSALRDFGLRWADTAKKVSMDGGALRLDKVFELIIEGENLPVNCVKELKLLRDRSMLYCICRRPYDQRAVLACDKCNEWYHFDCMKISSTPKIYVCPACILEPGEDIGGLVPIGQERFTGSKFEEPQTPLRRTELRKKLQKRNSVSKKTLAVDEDRGDVVRNHSGCERLFWSNRKPFRRAAQKRSEFQSLSPFLYVRNN